MDAVPPFRSILRIGSPDKAYAFEVVLYEVNRWCVGLPNKAYASEVILYEVNR